jgi:hypothetical protein
LESYHPYLLPQEVSKTPTTLGTYGSLPKIKKGHFGLLRPLGVKPQEVPSFVYVVEYFFTTRYLEKDKIKVAIVLLGEKVCV